MVKHLKNLLESHGINCVLKNENLGGAAGELPPTECWPELWLTDDKDYDEACRLVSAGETIQPPWTCGGCGEVLEGQFDRCWNCGEYRLN